MLAIQAHASNLPVLPLTTTSEPDTCPVCHRGIHPVFITARNLPDRKIVQVIFACTHSECQENFVATYDTPRTSPTKSGYFVDLKKVAPISPLRANFPKEITDLSPSFVVIYDQVLHAEGDSLDQLVGIGLRKALEFLIKDYASSENQQDLEKIQKLPLAQCINKYVTDSNVLQCAKRAVWLGNDEAHYARKWDAMDVTDLKRLVGLTVNWIQNSLVTKQYLANMEEGK